MRRRRLIAFANLFPGLLNISDVMTMLVLSKYGVLVVLEINANAGKPAIPTAQEYCEIQNRNNFDLALSIA